MGVVLSKRVVSLEKRVSALEGLLGASSEPVVGYLEAYRVAMKKIEERRELAAKAAVEARARAGKTDEMDAEDVEDAGREWMRH